MYLSSKKRTFADPTGNVVTVPSDQYVNIIVDAVTERRTGFFREGGTKQDRTSL